MCLLILKVFHNYKETEQAKKLYEEIIDQEFENGMPEEVSISGKKKFDKLNLKEKLVKFKNSKSLTKFMEK